MYIRSMAKGIKGSGATEDVPARTTFLIKPSIMRKMKYVALMDRTTQTEIVNSTLSDYLEKWQKKNGAIPVK